MSRDLHALKLRPDQWWACHEPERPVVPRVTMFDERCERCLLGAEAAVRLGRISYLLSHDPETGELLPQRRSIAQLWEELSAS